MVYRELRRKVKEIIMKKIIVLIIAVLSFVFSPSAYCREQKAFKGVKFTKAIPAPSLTKKVRTQKMQLMNNDFTTTIYSSKLSFKQVADFYSKRLTKNGWQNLFLDKNIKKHIGPAVFSNQMVFKKDDEVVTITYLPTSAVAGETRFSLGRGKISFSESAEEQKSTAKATKASDVLVYPNAELVSFSFDSSGNKPLGYTTSDSVEEVFQFYRDKMLFHGWVLEGEVFPTQQEINPQDLEKIPQYGQLPSAVIEQIGNVSIKMGYSEFKKGKRACMIGVVEMSSPDSSENKTLISIVYSDQSQN